MSNQISQVILKVLAGALSGQTFDFVEPTVCIVGRDDRCQIKLPNDQAHSTISRFHCLLDISPPNIWVRDFGSLNGTYLNAEKIGQRPEGSSIEEARKQQYPERNLENGDRLQIGETVFDIQIINNEPQRQLNPDLIGKEEAGFNFLAVIQNLFQRATQRARRGRADG